jgi:molybdopterin-containing oxidoreductase family membrane subunit
MYDGLMLFGSFGIFMSLYLLFCRFLPIIAMSEVKGILSIENHAAHAHDDSHGQSH